MEAMGRSVMMATGAKATPSEAATTATTATTAMATDGAWGTSMMLVAGGMMMVMMVMMLATGAELMLRHALRLSAHYLT
jgi:hypothetical protein